MDRFEIVKSLSQGGMADLFLARVQTAIGAQRTVVIKRLRLKYTSDPEFAAMFIDEARLALALEHANIARAYEVGTWDGALYIALEHLRGADLGQLMAAAPAAGLEIGLEPVLTIARGVAAALEYAHTRVDPDGKPLRIIHRDVSPGNVFVCDDGQVKLLDFGVASYGDRVSRRTPRGIIKGKFPYMSPEQCQGDDLDPRSDLFSLGVMLYELTTGRRPFRGLRAVDIVRRVLDGEIDPPSRLVTGYPPELEQLVMRLLSKRPGDRHASARELGRELEEVARRLGLVLAPGPVSSLVTAALASGAPGDLRAAASPGGMGGEEQEDTVALFPTPVTDIAAHTVLVVDDEEAVHLIMKSQLAGYQRISAYNGAQALDALTMSRIDVVLLDLNLPDLSGYDVLERIRRLREDVAVIVCTAQSDVTSAVESMRRGAFDFLVKSHESYEELPRQIQRALMRRRARGAGQLPD
jgi:serine/threonine protein kinase/CheY-like chemotaxis protein